MSIKGKEYPIRKIFSTDFDFIIPRFQRPYAWTTDETSELFDDLYEFFNRQDPDDTYFLGSIVLVKEEDKPRSKVVDGQQRLTTLTILLAAIESQLPSDYTHKFPFKNYIIEPGKPAEDIVEKPRLTLRSRDEKFFHDHIQRFEFDRLLETDISSLNSAQQNIQLNSKCLLDKINNKFKNNYDSIYEFGKFLIQKCYLVVVSTPNQQSAFRVFSILNNRGLDLLPSDILKAEIIGEISSPIQERYAEKWERLEVDTGRNSFNDLFGHIRMIYVKEKAHRTLLEEFKSNIIENPAIFISPESFIDNVIEKYAGSYIVAKSQTFSATTQADDVNYLLGWLNRIDNSDWLPPAIFFLSKSTNPVEILRFFKMLERLAAFLLICAKNINQRIARYVKVIESIEKWNSMETIVGSLDLSNLEIKEFKQTLNGNIYELTPNRRNYVMHRLDSYLAGNNYVAGNYKGLLTIEHVLPQTVDENSEWNRIWPNSETRDEWSHRISNLVLLNRSRNSKAQNYDFSKKKDAYFSGTNRVTNFALTVKVLNEKRWDLVTVERRQNYLIECFQTEWNLK